MVHAPVNIFFHLPIIFLADKAKALFLLAFPAQLFSGNGRFSGWNLFFRSLPKRFFQARKGAADGRFSQGSGVVPLWRGAVDGRFPGMAFPGEISF
jgi:hypothetical protein